MIVKSTWNITPIPNLPILEISVIIRRIPYLQNVAIQIFLNILNIAEKYKGTAISPARDIPKNATMFFVLKFENMDLMYNFLRNFKKE